MWPNPQFPTDLVTFTEEILNGKLHFLCSVSVAIHKTWSILFDALREFFKLANILLVIVDGKPNSQIEQRVVYHLEKQVSVVYRSLR